MSFPLLETIMNPFGVYPQVCLHLKMKSPAKCKDQSAQFAAANGLFEAWHRAGPQWPLRGGIVDGPGCQMCFSPPMSKAGTICEKVVDFVSFRTTVEDVRLVWHVQEVGP